MNTCKLTNAFFLWVLSFATITLVGCKKDSDSNKNDEYFYDATIGGVHYRQAENNDFEAGAGRNGHDDVAFYGGIFHISGVPPSGLTSFLIEKGLFHNYFASTYADFKAFFAPGNYPYVPAGGYNNGDGVIIGWQDPAGGNWSTLSGTADQTGSTFKIVSVEDAPDAIGREYIKVKIEFNCKFYNENSGAMKLVKNGVAVLSFGK